MASAVCGARTIAIEPDPKTMASLQRNVTANRIEARVIPIEAAVGAAFGVARFTVGCDTTNRVATAEDVMTREVRMRTLDDVTANSQPVMIKMDVEGYEAEAMAGSNETLRKTLLLAVQLETVDRLVRRQLEAAGFCRASYDPFTRQLAEYVGPLAAPNSLFVRDLEACRRRVEAAPRRNIFGELV